MILLHIITNQESQAVEIADFLMERKLILDPIIQEKIKSREGTKDGKFKTVHKTMMLGKTKSLLFCEIDKKLREKYPDNMPLLYSIPIVDMDWEQADQLISETAKI